VDTNCGTTVVNVLEKVLANAVSETEVCRREAPLDELTADVGGRNVELGRVTDTVILTTWVSVLSNEIKVS